MWCGVYYIRKLFVSVLGKNVRLGCDIMLSSFNMNQFKVTSLQLWGTHQFQNQSFIFNVN